MLSVRYIKQLIVFKLFKNKWFIIILFFFFSIFAISVIAASSGDSDFLYHEEKGDIFDVIDTLD